MSYVKVVSNDGSSSSSSSLSTAKRKQFTIRRKYLTEDEAATQQSGFSGDAFVVSKILCFIMLLISGVVLLMGIAAKRIGFVIVWQVVYLLFLSGEIIEFILIMTEVSDDVDNCQSIDQRRANSRSNRFIVANRFLHFISFTLE